MFYCAKVFQRRDSQNTYTDPRLLNRPRSAGMTLIEVLVAATLLVGFGAAGIEAMLTLNRNASSIRIIEAAREIVQRNIETAIATPFSSGNVPAIMGVTTGIGWNESTQSDCALGSVSIPLMVARDGTTLATGTLKRTVSLFTPSGIYNSDTRRVTFQLDYSLNGRPARNYAITTIRSPDK